ncbi:hypothetical protein [Nocardioides panaciterrulae]|uniref:Uncharacterized protein n=1 Tax=Nocardioides panaciterrulae TaxID=661492 RepID=A0A7Y9E2W2_9ACTN|nr:hypothetical protein [Nocardioides panaciterrulae]NYD40017.1 hypothetical protein [Nocardioides panaciterrulae]
MRPLQSVAMGLVIIALAARVHGYDVLADPAGWVLVLAGVRLLPRRPARAGTVRALAVLAGLAGLLSVPLWFPAVVAALEDADESLLWAATLPQLAFVAALTAGLARAATEQEDRAAAAWLRTASTLTVVAAVAPLAVYGAGQRALLVPTLLLATGVLVLVIWLLFSYAARPWARSASEQATGAAPPEGGTAPAA